MKLKELGEFRFIDRITAGCLIRKEGVIKAIGDDCCVFRTPENRVTLLTTDMLVEDIHFLRNSITPHELGRKSLAVNISDIAAMGGIPGEAVISIAIPGTIEVEYLDQLYEGMKSMARQFDVNLLGGDTTSSPQHLVINVALMGWAAEDEVLYRSGAKAGDVIFLTGAVGTSAAGLDLILSGKKFSHRETLLEAHHNPLPQIKEGRIIAGLRVANSLIDVSDGVASDLGHICDESGVGAVLEESRIPVTDAFRAYCSEFSLDMRKAHAPRRRGLRAPGIGACRIRRQTEKRPRVGRLQILSDRDDRQGLGDHPQGIRWFHPGNRGQRLRSFPEMNPA